MKETLKAAVNRLTLNVKGWQILLGLALVAFIVAVTAFGVAAIRDYYLQRQAGEIADELKASKEKLLELEKITAESLGALKETKSQLAKETLKRIEADRLLADQKGVTDEAIKNYDEAKRRITVDNNDYTTDELCLRAQQFGIQCK